MQLLASDDSVIDEFQIWDPRFGLEEDAEGAEQEEEMTGRIVRRTDFRFELAVPFRANLSSVQFVETGTRIEVDEVIRSFCQERPEDPACRERG